MLFQGRTDLMRFMPQKTNESPHDINETQEKKLH